MSKLLTLITLIACLSLRYGCEILPIDGTPPGENNGDEVTNDDQTDGDDVGHDVEVSLPPGGAGAATNLQATPSCDEVVLGREIARLTWDVATNRGTEQRVQVTIIRDGFDGADANVSAPLPPDQTSLVWDQLRGQAIHFWRALTLQPEGWVPSETASFEGPTCVEDLQQPPTEGKQQENLDNPERTEGLGIGGETVSVGGPGAAKALKAEVQCDQEDSSLGVARLSWAVPSPPGEEQLVEVTIRRDGFPSAHTERSAVLPANQDSLVWKRLRGQAIHYWRVLTKQGDGWVASEPASFEGPPCVADLTSPCSP